MTTKTTLSKAKKVNSFRSRKFEDFEILDYAGAVVGHIRVKPSGVAWSPKSGNDWYSLPLTKLAKLAVEHGKKIKNKRHIFKKPPVEVLAIHNDQQTPPESFPKQYAALSTR